MNDYFYTSLRVAVFAFSIFTILSELVALSVSALSGEILLTVYHAAVMLVWFDIAARNKPSLDVFRERILISNISQQNETQ